MHTLVGPTPEEGTKSAVSRSLRWNTGRESQKLKWKEVECLRMNYANLQWRRKLVQDTVGKADVMIDRNLETRAKGFGSPYTVPVTVSESRSGPERTLSHTRTRASTSAKVAVRKIRGGRIRGMKVLAHMNTAKWNTRSRPARELAIRCPCEGDIQDLKHVVTMCSYMVD